MKKLLALLLFLSSNHFSYTQPNSSGETHSNQESDLYNKVVGICEKVKDSKRQVSILELSENSDQPILPIGIAKEIGGIGYNLWV